METIIIKMGRMVIPSKIRRQFEIKAGTRIVIETDEKDRSIILTPITKKYIDSLHGKSKGKGLMTELMEEKQNEIFERLY